MVLYQFLVKVLQGHTAVTAHRASVGWQQQMVELESTGVVV